MRGEGEKEKRREVANYCLAHIAEKATKHGSPVIYGTQAEKTSLHTKSTELLYHFSRLKSTKMNEYEKFFEIKMTLFNKI